MRRVAPVLLTTLLLAGCGSDDETSTSGLATPGAVPPAGTTTAPGPSTGPGAPNAPTTTEARVQRPDEPLWCPGTKGDEGGAASDGKGRFDARELLGLPTAEASAMAQKHGCVLRIVRRDGQDLVGTMDLRVARINATETKGRVVALDGIG